MNIYDAKELGFDPQRLERLGALTQRYVDTGKLPGFVSLVARHGKIAYLNTCGYRDIATQTPYEMDTIFRIYSMTKPITSVSILQLYEQTLFNLHDPIAKFLPEFANMTVFEEGRRVPVDTPITFQHLLTHTAGLTYGGFGEPNLHQVDVLYNEMDFLSMKRTLAEAVGMVAGLPLRFRPGQKWHYSVATDVLGRLIEVISGQTLDTYFAEHIFEPLGMADTAFHIEPSKLDRFATLYHITPDDPLAILDHPETSDYLPPVKGFSGGGGLVSTIRDYFRFASCLLNKGEMDGIRILGRKTVERMQMNHLPSALLPISYEFDEPMHGLGFGLGVSTIMDIAQSGMMGSNGDFGWGGYAETFFLVDPSEDLVAINMTQCIPSSFYPVRKEFRTAVYQALVS